MALYTEEDNTNTSVPSPTFFPTNSEEDWTDMSLPPTKGEVKTVLFSIGNLKAPRPDGFHATFFNKNWEIIKSNFCAAVLDILVGKSIPETLNDTFLAIVPKVDHPNVAS